VFSATEEHGVSLRQVHAADGGRIRYKRFCELDGEEVAYSDIAKGYELSNGEVVVLTDDDFADLPLTTSRAIDVLEFVPLEQVDPMYFAKSYYLEPDAAGAKPYVLLREALERSGKVGVATFVFRAHGHVGVIRPFGRALILNQLRFQHQLKDVDDLSLALPKPKEGELKMALSLVRAMTSGFEPAAYKDEYRHELERLIKLKAKGKPIVAAPAPELSATKLDDLVDALTKSLARRAAPTRAAATRRGTRAKKKAPHRRKKSS
jgi:DNA end-binding protein Ku